MRLCLICANVVLPLIRQLRCHLLPREKAFYENLNAYYRRGELCSPEFTENQIATKQATAGRPYGCVVIIYVNATGKIAYLYRKRI